MHLKFAHMYPYVARRPRGGRAEEGRSGAGCLM